MFSLISITSPLVTSMFVALRYITTHRNIVNICFSVSNQANVKHSVCSSALSKMMKLTGWH